MKRFTIPASIVVAVLCLSLLYSAPPISHAQRTQATALDAQALTQARAFFSRMSAKCGDYYYYQYTLDKSRLFQCRYSPSVSVEGKTYEPRRLSEADRLNGVDPLPIAWEGRAIVNLGLCRSQWHSRGSLAGYDAWEAWLDKNHDAVRLVNRKGKWEFSNAPTGREAYTVKVIVPVNCANIPSAARRNPARPPYWAGAGTGGRGYVLRVPATFDQWFFLGRGPMRLKLPNVFSNINIDGTNTTWSPSGHPSVYGVEATAGGDTLGPGLKRGALIAKAGREGRPFQLFTDASSLLQGYRVNSSEEVFIAINDSYFADNRGEHIVIVEGGALNVAGATMPGSEAATEGSAQPDSGAGYRKFVGSPWTRYLTHTRSYFKASLPANWKAVADTPDSTVFAPEGAYGAQGITHGVVLGRVQTRAAGLEGANQEFVSGILRVPRNAHLKPEGNSSRTTLAGRPALSTVLAGRSPISGWNEQVVIITTLTSDSQLFYFGTVAPLLEYHPYRNAFEAILRSLQLTAR